jgi:hypothetical protein
MMRANIWIIGKQPRSVENIYFETPFVTKPYDSSPPPPSKEAGPDLWGAICWVLLLWHRFWLWKLIAVKLGNIYGIFLILENNIKIKSDSCNIFQIVSSFMLWAVSLWKPTLGQIGPRAVGERVTICL